MALYEKVGSGSKVCESRKDVYEDSKTAVRCVAGMTNYFTVKVGLHQGLAVGPFFSVVKDRLTRLIQE